MIAAQGGDPDATLPVARETHVVNASADGMLTTLDAYAVGVAAWRLGAGRPQGKTRSRRVPGIEMHAKAGDEVRAGEPLLTLHTGHSGRFERALAALEGGIEIGAAAGERPELIIDRIA